MGKSNGMIEIITSLYFALFFILWMNCLVGNTYEIKKSKFPTALFSIALIILLVGLRWNTGTDWNSYKDLFDTITFDNFNDIRHFDIGYKFFNVLINSITSSYSFFLFMDSLVAIGLIYKALGKIDTNRLVSILFFFVGYCIAHYFGSNRRIIAIGFVFCGLVYIYKEKKAIAILFLIMAFLFHRSSIISFIALFVPRKRYSYKQYVLVLLFCFVVGYSGLLFSILDKILSVVSLPGSYIIKSAMHYIRYGAEESSFSHYILATCKRLIFVITMLYFERNCKNKSPVFAYFFNLYIISICGYFLTSKISIFQILTTYFAISEIILWGNVFKYSSKKNKEYLMLIFLFLGTIQVLNSFPMYKDLFIPYISTFSKTYRRMY